MKLTVRERAERRGPHLRLRTERAVRLAVHDDLRRAHGGLDLGHELVAAAHRHGRCCTCRLRGEKDRRSDDVGGREEPTAAEERGRRAKAERRCTRVQQEDAREESRPHDFSVCFESGRGRTSDTVVAPGRPAGVTFSMFLPLKEERREDGRSRESPRRPFKVLERAQMQPKRR